MSCSAEMLSIVYQCDQYLEGLNVGIVSMFKMHNEWVVSTFKSHNIGTVPTFKMHNIGTKISYIFSSNLDCMAERKLVPQ